MENSENIHTIPDPDEKKVQEENSSPVAETEIITTTDLPTESNQNTELKSTEEYPGGLHGEEAGTVLSEEEIPEEVAEQETREPGDDLDHLTREQLVEQLEKAVGEPDINAVKTRIALIKVAFLKKKKEENLQKYERILEE